MYSESRVTRSKARSLGLEQFAELPLSCTKGRTTSKKLQGRAAFFDVTNADQSLSSEDSTSSVRNLSADLAPAKAEITAPEQSSPSATPGNAACGEPDTGDDFVLDAVLPNAEDEPAPLLHEEQSAEAEKASKDANNESTSLSAVQPVADILQNKGELDAAGSTDPHLETKSDLQEQISVMEPTAEEFDADVKAATPVQQGSLHSFAQGTKGVADSALHTSHSDEAPSQEEDAAQFSSADTPKQSLGCNVFASTDVSATPATIRQPELSDQPALCDVPATFIAKQSDAGHLMADSLTPNAERSTPARVTAAAASPPQASPALTSPNTSTPAAVGLLDAAYFSESDPDMGSAVQKSAKRPAGPNAALQESAAPTQGGPKDIDTIDPVYFCESDAESAEAPPSSGIKDINGPTGLNSGSHSTQPTMAPEQPFSPGMGAAHKPALDSADGPMTSRAAVTGDSAGMLYSISHEGQGHESFLGTHDSSAPEVDSVLPVDKCHVGPTYTEGWSDRWQMEDAAAPALNNDYTASAPASRLSSEVYASPSYDSRSLKQLRKEVADKLARQAAAKAQAGANAPPPPPASTPAGLYESESDADMSPGPATHGRSDTKHIKDVDGDELCNALESLEIQSAGKSKEPLRGLPVPQGMHLRFDDKGQAISSPSTTQTRLRGVPVARNSHIRFD